ACAGETRRGKKKNAYLIKKSTAGCQCSTRALENLARCSGNREDEFRSSPPLMRTAPAKLLFIFYGCAALVASVACVFFI
ncbi:hypothetical protein ILYODFUR_019260, partial [Ilyodon furcidens]